MGEKLLEVTVYSPEKVIFQGSADRVILPGEYGVFEIIPFHKQILSRLLTGTIVIDEKLIAVYRGFVRVRSNAVLIIMEEEKK